MWGRLVKLLRREGADPIISAKFYDAVVQAVLLFGSETWVLTAAMLHKLKEVHVGFLRQEGADRVIQAAGAKPLQE